MRANPGMYTAVLFYQPGKKIAQLLKLGRIKNTTHERMALIYTVTAEDCAVVSSAVRIFNILDLIE